MVVSQEAKTGPVVFVALGSRGDVQPLALIASKLSERLENEVPPRNVAFLSHAELEKTLREGPEKCLLRPSVEFRPLPLPCFLKSLKKDIAENTTSDGLPGAKIGSKSDGKMEALPCVLDLGGQRRAEWVAAAVLGRDASFLVGNMFALAIVYHLAERLSVPWMVTSPSLVPYSAPPGFKNAFSEDFPELFRAFREGLVKGWAWEDVESWLWPIFTDNHALFREELLGLPPVPGYDDLDRLATETIRAGRLLMGLPRAMLDQGCEGQEEFVEPNTARSLTSDKVTSWSLPPKAEPCGAWLAKVSSESAGLPQIVEEYLKSCSSAGVPVFYAGFGSMGLEGLVPDSPQVLKVVKDTAKWMKCAAIVMAHQIEGASADDTPDSFSIEGQTSGWPGILVARADLPHSELLVRCRAALHHGGIGTTLACAAAGIPQLVVPLAFDQFFWAARLAELKLGTSIPIEGISVFPLARAMQQLFKDPEFAAAAAKMAAKVGTGGLETAVEVMLEEIRKSSVVAISSSPAVAVAAAGDAAAADNAASSCPPPSAALSSTTTHPPSGSSSSSSSSSCPFRAPRLVPLWPARKGEAPPPRVWARCAGEVQYVHSEITLDHCYGNLEELPNECLIVDAGMNLGLFSLALADVSKKRNEKGLRGRFVVLAFEPAEETYSLALRNFQEHHVPHVDHGASLEKMSPSVLSGGGGENEFGIEIHCFRLALSNVDEETELCYLPYLSSNSSLKRHRADKENHRRSGAFDKRLVEFFFAQERVEKVKAVQLSTVLSLLSPPSEAPLPLALLKVDVEGAEAEVLRGLSKAHWAWVQSFAAEVHTKKALDELKALLTDNFAGEVRIEQQMDLNEHWMLYANRCIDTRKRPPLCSVAELEEASKQQT